MKRLARSLNNVGPFSRLSTGELASLDKLGNVVRAEPNEVICQAGATLNGALILVSGEVAVERSDSTVNLRGPGPLIATGALLGDRPCDHTLTALSEVVAIELPRDAFEQLCLERHPLGRTILTAVANNLVERVRILNQTLNDLLSERDYVR